MHKTIFSLAIAGLLFSGYMSSVKFFSGACAFNESCPYFLGYPACYFGFAMYVLITLFAGCLLWQVLRTQTALTTIAGISLLGIVFAGYFTLGELPILFSQGFRAYLLGLPTCALGLLFYIALFTTTLIARRRA